ncbi:cytochrome b [Oleomonas cavernae]|uniref:Cytochrome b n=1 Tax=Oleomonas cavernae TaxID=2320859 RepID=A0A418VUE9_9PROT|nr:cytochrome b/b6 domain-containing protein [Oleomonas cavernae]RJF80763.1 cytochrome b [Oleomonas cavernae]
MPRRRPATERTARWSTAQRRLHWAGVALVLAALILAWVMTNIELRALLWRFWLYQAHKTVGLLVLALVVGRIWLRVTRYRPPLPPAIPLWQRRAADAGHALLYGLLTLVPALGLLVADTAPINVPTLVFGLVKLPSLIGPSKELYDVVRPLHELAAYGLLALATGHGLMALHHHRRGLSVLRRMWW